MRRRRQRSGPTSTRSRAWPSRSATGRAGSPVERSTEAAAGSTAAGRAKTGFWRQVETLGLGGALPPPQDRTHEISSGVADKQVLDALGLAPRRPRYASSSTLPQAISIDERVWLPGQPSHSSNS